MANHAVRFVEVGGEGEEGQRLDNFVLARLKGVPRSRVYRMLRRGEVRVNGARARPAYRLRRGDAVRLPPYRGSDAASPDRVPQTVTALLRDRVIFEDRDLLVLDKPAGLAAHGGSGVSFGVIETLRRLEPNTRYELVHRLDRDTSGCLAVAKRRSALVALHAAFREGAVGKRYDLVVAGHWPDARRTVRDPLKRYRMANGERRVRVDPAGDPARTDFAVVARLDDPGSEATWLAAHPKTGRTHQIRVHAAAVGHPIRGDDKYAPKPRGRLMLHATELTLPIADRTVHVAAPLPADFTRLRWVRAPAD